MKNYKSNEDMEQVFQKLASIKKVEPETNLYDSINNRIQGRDVISLTWLRAAAAIFIILFTSEMILLKSDSTNSSSAELSELVPPTNNLLYHE
jgi:hypothetical protein